MYFAGGSFIFLGGNGLSISAAKYDFHLLVGAYSWIVHTTGDEATTN